MRRAWMAAAMAMAMAAWLAPPAAAAAAELRIPAGGRLTTWAVTPTTTGTYALTRSFVKRRPVVRMARVTAAGPQAVPAPPVTLDADLSTAPSEDGASPCVGTMVKSSPYIACLVGGAWVERRFTGADRTRILDDINAYGGALYATLIDGDFGALQSAHPERAKLAARLMRWDGAAWVPAIPSYSDTFKQWTQLVPCLTPGDAACTTPLAVVGALFGDDRFKTRRLGGSAWTPEPRSIAIGRTDTTIGPVVAAGDRLAVPLTTSPKGKVSAIVVQTDSGAPHRIRVATFIGDYAGASLSVVGGRTWLAWTDFYYFDKRETKGLVVGRAAPLDLQAGTAGAATEIYADLFKGTPSSVGVEDVDGAPYASYIAHGATQDALVLVPIAP